MKPYQSQLHSLNLQCADHVLYNVEFEHKPKIIADCVLIHQYLQANKHAAELKESISGLVQMTFEELKDEIEGCFIKEEREIFPAIRKSTAAITLKQKSSIQSIKLTQDLILQVVRNLRQVVCDFVIQPNWSIEFRELIDHLYSLENNIYQWIETEEKLLWDYISDPSPEERVLTGSY